MSEPRISIPVSLLVDLHSQASPDSREQIESVIRDYKKTVDRKGHIAEGFWKTDAGALKFDNDLYWEAVYRGKISTYSDSLHREIAKLKEAAGTLQAVSEEQQKSLAAVTPKLLQQRIGCGESISEDSLRLLNRLTPRLKDDSNQ